MSRRSITIAAVEPYCDAEHGRYFVMRLVAGGRYRIEDQKELRSLLGVDRRLAEIIGKVLGEAQGGGDHRRRVAFLVLHDALAHIEQRLKIERQGPLRAPAAPAFGKLRKRRSDIATKHGAQLG